MLCITQIGGKKRTKTGKQKNDSAGYYAKYLADQHEAGEPVGKFFGAGLADFGLEGKTPDFKTLNHLFNGEDLQGNKLVKGNQYRKNAYDLTFNCSKDVSILFALAGEEERKLIEQAQQRAVEKAIEYIQNNATFTRLGRGGEETVQVKRLIAATFEHSTARIADGDIRPDPHLHTHCVIANMVMCDDGKVRTIHPDFYRHQMSASAIHSAELAHALRELGFSIEPDKNSFKVAGVSKNIKSSWSSRRDELLTGLDELKLDGSVNIHKRKELAALGTRREKGEINRNDLFQAWQDEAKAYQVELEAIRGAESDEIQEKWSVENALKQLTLQQSTFTTIKLHKQIALSSITDGSAEIIDQRYNEVLESSELVSLGIDKNGDKRFTTKEVLEIERSVQSYARSRKLATTTPIDENHINAAIQSRGLSGEQYAMVKHCCGADGVVAVQGSAGAGKSYALGAVKEAMEASGINVLGCALSAVAAQNLEEGSGIKSGTIHRLIYDIENGYQSLNKKSAVVIDEAGTADTRLIHRLMQHANGARLIFVGDSQQLEAIGLSFFRNLQQSIGYVELSENRRQKDQADRDAVQQFRQGEIADALRSYAQRGLITIEDDAIDSQNRLISDWNQDRKQHGDIGIILASTNRECRELNQLAREMLLADGRLINPQAFSSEYGTIEIAEGDRIIFGKNDVRLGVKNGSQATVISVKESQYTARLDSGDITINPDEYGYFRHSYAITTHKAQGQSVSRAYIYSSGKMLSKELGYVQLTRAKEATRIYADRESLGEMAFDELSRQMNRSQQKETAIDLYSDGSLYP